MEKATLEAYAVFRAARQQLFQPTGSIYSFASIILHHLHIRIPNEQRLHHCY
jgi:hypothetical protein